MRSFIKVLRQNPVQQKLSTNEQVNSWSKMVLLLSILSEFWFRLFKMCMVLINLPTKNDQELSKFMVFSRIQTDLYTGFHYYKTGRLLDHYMADSPGDIWKCVSAALDASTSSITPSWCCLLQHYLESDSDCSYVIDHHVNAWTNPITHRIFQKFAV